MTDRDLQPAAPLGEAPSELGTTSGASVVLGGAWGVLTAIVPALQTLVISIAAARFLGPADFGRQSLIAFVSVSLVAVFASRMPSALARFGAQVLGAGDAGVLRTLFRWTLTVQLVSGAVAALGFAVAAFGGAEPGAAWVLAGLLTWVAMIQAAPSSMLVAAQRWRDSILPGLLTTIAGVVVVVPVLALGGGIAGYFAVELAMVLVGLAWTASLSRRLAADLPEAKPIDPAVKRDLKRFMQGQTFFAVVEFVVLSRSEVVFLQWFSTPTEVGYYSVAFAAAAAAGRVPQAVTNVAIPSISSLHGAGQADRIRSGYWRAIRLLVLVGPLLVALAAGLGTQLLGIAYGAEFRPAEGLLAILLAPYVVLPMTGIADAVLWTVGRIRFLVLAGLAAVVVDVGLAALLIPLFDATGAAVTNVGAQLVAGIPSLVLVASLLGPVELHRRLALRSLLVAAVVAALALLPQLVLGSVGAVVVGAALSAAFLWILSGRVALLDRDDAEWLADALGHRLGGRPAALARRVGG